MAVIMNEEGVKNKEQMEALFKAGAHFAFSKSRRHPSMAPFIFGAKNKVEIFDLEKVADLLEDAKEYMKKLGKERKRVLFVGGKNEARDVVRTKASEIEMPFVAGRWIGGTLTNYSEIKKRIARLNDLTEKREKGELSKFTKLERLHIDREIEDLEKTFGGVKGMDKLPHALFVVDAKHEEIAVAEAQKTGIPVVGILNSDCNSSHIEHFIPGNDSSVASITYFVNELVSAYAEGLKSAPAPKVEAKKEVKKSK
jgi:small subunit ribosomal protein S2